MDFIAPRRVRIRIIASTADSGYAQYVDRWKHRPGQAGQFLLRRRGIDCYVHLWNLLPLRYHQGQAEGGNMSDIVGPFDSFSQNRESVLITGASGGIGAAAVQMAVAMVLDCLRCGSYSLPKEMPCYSRDFQSQ